ncbi:MAG: hypothetical protein KKF80_06300 [Candidatus Omnitrophica bacterium]|nr:hypothetical protein [Candidatus Omnitrophota bacterium]
MTEQGLRSAKSANSVYIRRFLNQWENGGKEEVIEPFSVLRNQFQNLHDHHDVAIDEQGLSPFSLVIDDVREKAYQRAFFIYSPTTIIRKNKKPMRINWLDIEVPVNLRSERRIDLIGKIPRVGFAIAEIKSRPGGEESPLYAVLEALRYVLMVKVSIRNDMNMRCHNNANAIRNYWENYDDSKYLIAGANTSLWDAKGWRTHIGKVNEIGAWIQVNCGYRVLFVEYANEFFIGQRNYRRKYVPQLIANPNKEWFEV